MKNTIQQINEMAKADPQAFVNQNENEYISEIDRIAHRISNNRDIKIVALAGPSASGKTTSAHILCDRLKLLNETTTIVSLDNFYLPTELLPVLENGEKDIESVNSLDIGLIKKCFNEIIENGTTMLPKYDFTNRHRILNAVKADISGNGLIIVEGLHALNPLITDLVPKNNIFKIYISVNCPIFGENNQPILSSRQIRLVRRSLRDKTFRASSINYTLSLWNGVVEGERKYLYCFKETADVQLKTLHLYEPCVYRDRFIELEKDIDKSAPCYDYFLKTVNALKKFEVIDSKFLPGNSLIREFIGNGIYKL